MRATSSRSSTSRARCEACRCRTPLICRTVDGSYARRAENRRDVEDRCQRIAQLVREHGQELVLAPVRLQQPRLAVEELAMRDLQVVQELDQRRADQDEERDVGQPAERVAPAEVVLEQQVPSTGLASAISQAGPRPHR